MFGFMLVRVEEGGRQLPTWSNRPLVALSVNYVCATGDVPNCGS